MRVDLGMTRGIARAWEEHPYYDLAEQDSWTELFWREDFAFRRMFSELRLGHVVDLACGRGRHAERIVAACERLTMIDVNMTNIRACRRRLVHQGNVAFVCNDGVSIPLRASTVDALFCYDAMVHFEMDAVMSYIHETARVLVPGGRALFHHSNYDRGPGKLWSENPHLRNFMSRALFEHVAVRAGLKVLDACVIDWSDVPDLDALTLVAKPD